MDPAGKVAIVTGGASGIGRALAARLADDGARGVVIVDLDPGATATVAAEVDAGRGVVVGVRADATREEDVAHAIAVTDERFGPVDLFCANAGIGIGESEQAPDDVWDRAFAVNVRAHVVAARLLVPEWLERGSGYFLSTASAAALVTQIGSAPYAVTKHAALAFSEWLAVTYGDRGIGVSCLCPMGVDTPLLAPGEDGMDPLATSVVKAAGEILSPDVVAAMTVDAVREERFLVLPHPEVLEYFRQKGSDYDRWIGGMQRLRSHIAGID
ncbi:MAG: SDR family oxidoreductase [Solirubrobacteraceae bacterium]|nr:SDR family oxidoreductase [Solirubrobacteraceae bacterium]